MIKSSTQEALAHASPVEQRAISWYEECCAIPSQSLNTYPPMFHNTFIMWMVHNVIPKLGLGKVILEETTFKDKKYYRITIKSLFSEHHFVLTPLAAYMHAKAIQALEKHGVHEHMVVEGAKTGAVFIPNWSRRDVYNACRTIVDDHKDEIEKQLMFFNELMKDDDTSH